MNVDIVSDPFVPPPQPASSEQALESAWFDAPPSRRSSRPPCVGPTPSRPPAPIDDPVADPWFR